VVVGSALAGGARLEWCAQTICVCSHIFDVALHAERARQGPRSVRDLLV